MITRHGALHVNVSHKTEGNRRKVHEEIVLSCSRSNPFNDSSYGKHLNSLTVVDLVITGRDALGLFPKKLHEEP